MPQRTADDAPDADGFAPRSALAVRTSNVGPTSAPAAAAGRGTVEAYERHASEIHAFVLRIVRDPDAAADIVADAFTKLFTEEQAGRTPLQPRPWLYRVAANLATSRGRRLQAALRATRQVQRQERVEYAPSAERVLLDHERDRDLRDALQRVSVEERTALLLAAAGHDGVTIAGFIGKSHGATRALMCRARRRLRAALREQVVP